MKGPFRDILFCCGLTPCLVRLEILSFVIFWESSASWRNSVFYYIWDAWCLPDLKWLRDPAHLPTFLPFSFPWPLLAWKREGRAGIPVHLSQVVDWEWGLKGCSFLLPWSQGVYFSDVESGRPATLSPRCYDLVRRVLLLRVFAVMGAAFLQDRSLVSTVRNFLLLDFLPLGFLIFSFQGTGIPLVWPRT